MKQKMSIAGILLLAALGILTMFRVRLPWLQRMYFSRIIMPRRRLSR